MGSGTGGERFKTDTNFLFSGLEAVSLLQPSDEVDALGDLGTTGSGFSLSYLSIAMSYNILMTTQALNNLMSNSECV